MSDQDEFFIGWQEKAPPRIGKFVKKWVFVLLLMGMGLGVFLSLHQNTIGEAVFEFGNVKEFTGVFKKSPIPILYVKRTEIENAYSQYFLVNPFKFGLPEEVARQFDGKKVQLKGTLIYRDNQTMIEVVPDSFVPLGENRVALSPEINKLGVMTLRGEIVDSKCYFGVMNPGNLKPHRACAVRCISGGIPPVLLVRSKDKPAQYLLLVDTDGSAINEEVLQYVAEPIEITGQVEQIGDVYLLKASPSTYRRID